jgi:hypothetical protein
MSNANVLPHYPRKVDIRRAVAVARTRGFKMIDLFPDGRIRLIDLVETLNGPDAFEQLDAAGLILFRGFTLSG